MKFYEVLAAKTSDVDRSRTRYICKTYFILLILRIQEISFVALFDGTGRISELILVGL